MGPPLLTDANSMLGRRLALLVALFFVAIPMTADFAEARLPAVQTLGFLASAVSSGSASSDLAAAAWAEPSCALSGAGQVASAPCQVDKHTARPPAAIASRAPARYMHLQDARLPAWAFTPLDRPPNRLPV